MRSGPDQNVARSRGVKISPSEKKVGAGEKKVGGVVLHHPIFFAERGGGKVGVDVKSAEIIFAGQIFSTVSKLQLFVFMDWGSFTFPAFFRPDESSSLLSRIRLSALPLSGLFWFFRL